MGVNASKVSSYDAIMAKTKEGNDAARQHLRRCLALLFGIFITLNLVGCGTPVNMTTWQQSLETYVRGDGRGDPNVLRHLTIQNDQRGFEMIGGDDPRYTTDARGLLLGHKVVAGRPWFIYLVGIVHDQKVRELRLAALAVEGNRFHWVLGPKNSRATHMYRNYNEGLGKRRNPGQKHAPIEYSSFPRSEDQFELSINGDHVSVIHKGSGAWWEMTLPERYGSEPSAAGNGRGIGA